MNQVFADRAYQCGFRISAAEGVLENKGQLRVSVRHMILRLYQRFDAGTEAGQALVDVHRLFEV